VAVRRNLSRVSARQAAKIKGNLVPVQLANLVLNIYYFFLLPALLSGVILVCLLWAAWLLRDATA
jgi:hypothetical protein